MLNNAMSVVILAAGKGTRMYSDLPKVLHTLAGKAMVQHVIDAANELGAAHVHLVYGHGGDLLKQALKDDNLNWVLQAEQLGTGHPGRDRRTCRYSGRTNPCRRYGSCANTGTIRESPGSGNGPGSNRA